MGVNGETAGAPVELGGSNIAVRPPLKWAGGKRWLMPYLAELWKEHRDRRLVEPFCGGLAIALSLRPQLALLNDINSHAVHFYRWLKRGFKVDDGLKFTNSEATYYAHRERFNQLVANGAADSAEAAALFYYLNRTCYNGLCRFNSSGLFNVPFGRYQRINYLRDFTSYCEIVRDWQFSAADFQQLPVKPDDFLYADPPYDVEFRSYSKEGFSWGDQVRLAEWLSSHPGPIVVSNQATDRVLGLYRKLGFKVRILEAPRRINCTGDRSPAKEVLAMRGIN
ncbi:MAG: Dam family site-specific DNA-(adenine-N6)-methyltransferase [Deltaproteobacteria bacterium]|nr:Dam family site-specific DNA-(adenine-N6)-methyltransferase [Deltaproteobacteria bacterium]